MPVYFNIEGNPQVAIWKWDEELEELEKLYTFFEEEKIYYQQFNHPNRKKEWIACRLLLNKLGYNKMPVQYTESGKPFLADPNIKIAFTHSSGYSGVSVNTNNETGIDLERADRIKPSLYKRFLSCQEITQLHKEKKQLHATIHWCAKEAIVKMTDNKTIEFSTELLIEPFSPEQEGKISLVCCQPIKKNVNLQYKVFDNMVLVWTIE